MKKWIICFLLAGISFCTYAQTSNNGEQGTKVTKVKTKTKMTGDQNAAMQSSSANHSMTEKTNQNSGNSVAVHHKTTHGTAMHKKTSSTHKKTSTTAYKHHKINSSSGSAVSMTHTSGHNAKSHTGTTNTGTGTIETKTKIKEANGKVIKHKTNKSTGTTQQ